jgi:hypothetical protein
MVLCGEFCQLSKSLKTKKHWGSVGQERVVCNKAEETMRWGEGKNKGTNIRIWIMKDKKIFTQHLVNCKARISATFLFDSKSERREGIHREIRQTETSIAMPSIG